MQVLNLDAELNISRLDADIRTLRLGEGGTTNYNDLTNKPSINSVTLTGNKTTSDLNIKTSDLVNDAGFITNADIPTKTSDLINDDGFQTAAQVSTAVAAAIPTEVSAFTNDAGYITAAQVGNIPTKTSDLDNDSGFITSAEAPVQSVNGYTGAVNLVASDIEVSAGVTVADNLDSLASSIPTKTSELTNDSGFITSLNVPSKTSDLVNDSGFVTNQIDDSTTSATSTWSSSKIASYGPQTATITDTPIASFTDGADNVPVSSLIVDIDAVQAGNGTPSPDNVRPISGHSTCTIKVNDDIDDPQTEITTAISLGQTVYGGTLNVTTGELTVTHGIVDLGNLNWSYASPYYFYADMPSDSIDTQTLGGGGLCSNYMLVNIGVVEFRKQDKVITYNTNSISPSKRVFIRDTSYSDDATFKTAMSGVQLVYELATPTTVQLTPTEVRTLLGNNNIFADTGNINELVYFKTGCEALAKLIEAYT